MIKNCKFLFHDSIESTNSEIKKNYHESNSETMIALISKKQINGKGRLKRKWISDEGDLTCSFLINKKFSIDELGKINVLISVSIIESLEELYPDIDFKLKWPNDIYLNEKKLGGILIETRIVRKFTEIIIIGVGINFISKPVIENYETTRICDFSNVLNVKDCFFKISSFLIRNLNLFYKTNFNFYKKKWILRNKDQNNQIIIKKNDKFFSGLFIDLDDYGSLILKTNNNNLIKIPFGEII